MPVFFQYLIKLSISLGVMYLFYQLVLRRLTFYNHNRWYLFGYSVLCYFISFINIAPVLEGSGGKGYELINLLPAVGDLATTGYGVPGDSSHGLAAWNAWHWALVIVLMGIVVLATRLVLQFISFRKMQKNARLITGDGIRFYQVNRNIIPFSFGRSIYINQHLHSESELKEIVRHEFVHVRQRHTIDIIWAEFLCILNWYNPFAWLIKKAIRQNLEFIADNKVIANGVDKTHYQYLLLKVIGNNHFSITSQFNFTSLKKRIVMMNKIKSARVHLLKFLFVLPLAAAVLLAFRSPSLRDHQKPVLRYASMVIDADTREPLGGATILNINTNKMAQTDDRGFFTMELPADRPIHVKMLISRDGYSNLETSTFSLEKKDNTASIGLMEVITLKKGSASDKCTGCSSSISLREENNENLGYKEVRKYYEKLSIGLPAYIADTVPAPPAKPAPAPAAPPAAPAAPASPGVAPTPASPSIPSAPGKPLPATAPKSGSGSGTGSGAGTGTGSGMGSGKGSGSGSGSGNGMSIDPGKDGNPVVYVDGQLWPADLDLNIINANTIKSVNVLKGKSAVDLYGEKAKDGAIVIVTKKQPGKSFDIRTLKDPIYYINGKKVSRETVDLIEPDIIKSIDVLKGDKAVEKYGESARNGVIELTLAIENRHS